MTPYVSAAVGAYDGAVLAEVRDEAADPTVSLGRCLLQRVFGGQGQQEQLTGPLADLAADPDDEDAVAAVRLAVRKALAGDPMLAAEVRSMLAAGGVSQHARAGRDAYTAGRDVIIYRHGPEPGREQGCLVLADGRLPAVRDITDPVMLGVHRPAGRAVMTPDGRAVPGAPAYVPREVDAGLRELLAKGGFVLLAGDSTAGESRAAFEAVTATLPGHVLICPSGREAIGEAVDRAAQARRCVLWLDDLERYLGAGGLTAAQLGRLLTGEGHHRVIVATIRSAERARLTAEAPGDDAGRQASHDIRQVLEQACPILVNRMFTGEEMERAKARDWDSRIAEAIAHAGSYGIAEYLAAGPELLRDWQDARASSEGPPHARGAALVAAAIDIRRAGYTSPIPRALLDQVHEHYLADPEHAHAPREPAADAWAWATRRRRATTALLRPAGPNVVEVFDYLVDTVQRNAGPLGRVPGPVVRAAIHSAGPADADSLAATAYAQGRYALAEDAWQRAQQAKASDPAVGPDHPDTLTSQNNLARVLRRLGRLKDAEEVHRAVMHTRMQVLGPDHPDTLTSQHNLANDLRDLGQPEEAGYRDVLAARTRVLGPDHPDTLASRNNFGSILRDLGRPEDAEAEHRAALATRIRVLGPDHPDTLTSQNSLAHDLSDLGRPEEAEAGYRDVLAARTRVLGPDHPDTLTSRRNLAELLYKEGRPEEAEAGYRDVLAATTRLLGPDHPDTLTSRRNLAELLYKQGRLEEAEAIRAAPPPGTIS